MITKTISTLDLEKNLKEVIENTNEGDVVQVLPTNNADKVIISLSRYFELFQKELAYNYMFEEDEGEPEATVTVVDHNELFDRISKTAEEQRKIRYNTSS